MTLYSKTNAHCVLLKHYYSVDFPWWFDRKISFFSLLSKTCEMAECKATLCDLTEKLFVSNFIRWPNLQIILEVKSMNESSWKKNSIISVFILVFAGQVLFTVNGLNWSQSWQVFICLCGKSSNYHNFGESKPFTVKRT